MSKSIRVNVKGQFKVIAVFSGKLAEKFVEWLRNPNGYRLAYLNGKWTLTKDALVKGFKASQLQYQ